LYHLCTDQKSLWAQKVGRQLRELIVSDFKYRHGAPSGRYYVNFSVVVPKQLHFI
jgi:hypothetical protein